MVKTVEYTIKDEASIDNDMIFFLDQNVTYRSWDVTITGEEQNNVFDHLLIVSEELIQLK
jgi:hypothetical protein